MDRIPFCMDRNSAILKCGTRVSLTLLLIRDKKVQAFLKSMLQNKRHHFFLCSTFLILSLFLYFSKKRDRTQTTVHDFQNTIFQKVEGGKKAKK